MYNFGIRGSTTINFHPGNPPPLQYVHLGSTTLNTGIFFSTLSIEGEREGWYTPTSFFWSRGDTPWD